VEQLLTKSVLDKFVLVSVYTKLLFASITVHSNISGM